MCGLAGFVGARNEAGLDEMIRRIAHRGPDATTTYLDAETGVHLGHLRLAIIDLVGGVQPMWDEAGGACIVFNGEIYNFAAIRRELENLGVAFATSHSDTEVILRGYLQWGAGIAARLNGMFAFVIYDKRQGTLFIARDRFGEKPLYLSQSGGVFAFASEVQALLALESQSGTVDPTSLAKYFAYGFLPGQRSLYAGIRQLAPGHHATYSLAERTLIEEPYWRFRIASDAALERADEQELAEEFWAIFRRSVERRLVSDVPLGLFLSGGVDSSAVLAAATELIGRDSVRTFTIGFTEASFDESPYAETVAKHFGSVHRCEVMTLDRARDLTDVVLPRMGEPLSDASILPTYMLSEFTRKHVTVALSGDGGDELFAGYDPFVALRPAALASRLPKSAINGLLALSERLPKSDRNMSFDFRLRRALLGVRHERPYWEPSWMGPAQPEDLSRLLGTAWRTEDLYSETGELHADLGRLSSPDKTLEYFTHLYLPNDILVKSDRASMMCSLEGRAVFLDNEIADFCVRLPFKWKMSGGVRKRLLKTALAQRLPRAIIQRKKKGFGIPTGAWLRSLPSPVADYAGSEIDRGYADALHREHASGARDHRLLLWALLSFTKANSAWA